jgi:hypothetical protein
MRQRRHPHDPPQDMGDPKGLRARRQVGPSHAGDDSVPCRDPTPPIGAMARPSGGTTGCRYPRS